MKDGLYRIYLNGDRLFECTDEEARDNPFHIDAHVTNEGLIDLGLHAYRKEDLVYSKKKCIVYKRSNKKTIIDADILSAIIVAHQLKQ